MINDCTGKVLYHARYQDLVNEAKGGWLLKRAGRDESTPRKLNAIHRILPALLVIIFLAIGLTMEEACVQWVGDGLSLVRN